MVIANLDSMYVTCRSIWQYDYGMVLRLQGAKLPTATEIHFSFEEHSGEAKPRIGLTKDGITDVVIPDTFVENDFTSQDYKIYVFIYLTDENSCRTEYKITIPVKSRPRLEAFDKPEDTELFHEAINEVNKSATSAEESAIEAEAWAHGHEECPDRHEDNAKYYAQGVKEELMTVRAELRRKGFEHRKGFTTIEAYTDDQMKELKQCFN